ncbi:uncharacterized protein [Henckelia pumila]|uniref:uncharacterized protein n=1 Tax=Henckelia pumila TaxID=405737 RepID=UPI003C6DE7F3
MINGHAGVLAELVQVCPLAAREKVDGGGNALHLCVKYDRLECLETLVPVLNEEVIVNAKDNDGDTIMHISYKGYKSRGTRTQPVKWLTKKRDSIMVVAILIATMAFQAALMLDLGSLSCPRRSGSLKFNFDIQNFLGHSYSLNKSFIGC